MSSTRDDVRSARAVPARLGVRQLGVVPRAKRDFALRRLLALADAVAITTALAIAMTQFGYPAYKHVDTAGRLAWSLLALPGWIILFKLYGLYDRDSKRVSHTTVDELPRLFHGVVVGGLSLWVFFKLMPPAALFFHEGLAFCALALPALFVARASARSLGRILIPPERVLFLGGGGIAKLFIEKIRAHPEYRLKPIGYIDAEDSSAGVLSEELPYLGDVADLEEICKRAEIDRVVVLAPAVEQTALADLIRRTKGMDIRISILPHVVDVLGPSVEVDDGEGITVLGINPPALTRSSRFLKRALDVGLSVAVLMPALPIMALALVSLSPGKARLRR